jgi:hypothetical protein
MLPANSAARVFRDTDHLMSKMQDYASSPPPLDLEERLASACAQRERRPQQDARRHCQHLIAHCCFAALHAFCRVSDYGRCSRGIFAAFEAGAAAVPRPHGSEMRRGASFWLDEWIAPELKLTHGRAAASTSSRLWSSLVADKVH